MVDSAVASTERPLIKRCSRCGCTLPLEEFRRRSKGSDKPHADCRQCHRFAQQAYRAAKSGQRLSSLAAMLHRYRGSSIERIVGFVGAAIDSFGGLDGFGRAWKRNYKRAIKAGKLDVALRYLRMVPELMSACEPERQRLEDEAYDCATKDEIRETVKADFVEMIVEMGETDEGVAVLVGRLAQRFGYARVAS